jgi:uncharacterized protein
MKHVDYFSIIQKYIALDSLMYSIYVPHVTLVTAKALGIARAKGLSGESLRFIEEAGMLHDIGIVKVDSEKLGCTGALPYICHLTEGRKILEVEGLPRHARVASSHTGVGLFKEDVESNAYAIPVQDYVAETLEERIISWADVFFSKTREELWYERTMDEARETIARFGERHATIFDEWAEEFVI